MPVPTYDGLFNPLLHAMRELGGSASVAEQEDKVAQLLNLSEEEASEIHRANRRKLSNRFVWARSGKGQNEKKVDAKTINRLVKNLDAKESSITEKPAKDAPPPELHWEDE